MSFSNLNNLKLLVISFRTQANVIPWSGPTSMWPHWWCLPHSITSTLDYVYLIYTFTETCIYFGGQYCICNKLLNYHVILSLISASPIEYTCQEVRHGQSCSLLYSLHQQNLGRHFSCAWIMSEFNLHFHFMAKWILDLGLRMRSIERHEWHH